LLEFDCAHGRIPGAFDVDAEGRFNLKGVFVREHGGPVRSDEALEERAALYAGRIRGERMTLDLSLNDGAGEPTGLIASYTLEKGRVPNLMKCL